MLQLHFFQLTKSATSDNEHETDRVCQSLQLIKYILTVEEDSVNSELVNEFKSKFLPLFSKNLISSEFKTSFYSIFVNQILSTLTKINDQVKEAVLNTIFETNFAETFQILYDLSTNNSSQNLRTFHIYLLKQFLSKHQLRSLFIEQSNIQSSSMSAGLALIQKLTNLPDKMCNFAGTHKIFDSVAYFRMVAVDLWLCLKHFHTSQAEIASFQFLATVFGKISFLGFSGNTNLSIF
jgi:hypothetical protein